METLDNRAKSLSKDLFSTGKKTKGSMRDNPLGALCYVNHYRFIFLKTLKEQSNLASNVS